MHIEIATPSTSATTGALTVVGGVGISGDVNIAGDITFGGTGTTLSTTDGVEEFTLYAPLIPGEVTVTSGLMSFSSTAAQYLTRLTATATVSGGPSLEAAQAAEREALALKAIHKGRRQQPGNACSKGVGRHQKSKLRIVDGK
jgi:hypothetical protein